MGKIDGGSGGIPVEQSHRNVGVSVTALEGKDRMIRMSVNLRDLRNRIYVKTKAEKS